MEKRADKVASLFLEPLSQPKITIIVKCAESRSCIKKSPPWYQLLVPWLAVCNTVATFCPQWHHKYCQLVGPFLKDGFCERVKPFSWFSFQELKEQWLTWTVCSKTFLEFFSVKAILYQSTKVLIDFMFILISRSFMLKKY